MRKIKRVGGRRYSSKTGFSRTFKVLDSFDPKELIEMSKNSPIKVYSIAMAAVTQSMKEFDENLDRMLAQQQHAINLDAVNKAADRVKKYSKEEAETIIRRLHL